MAVEKDDLRAMFDLALLYVNQKMYKEAEKYYLMAVKKDEVRAMFNLALLYKNQERYKEAEKYFLMAVDKNLVDAMNNLALLYENQERYEEAEKYFLMAIEKNHVDAMNNLGNFYYYQERYAEAEKYYLMAINQGDSKALMNLTALRIQSNEVGQIPETRSLIEGFWKQNNDPIAKLAKVYFLLWAEEPHQAVPLLKETLPDVLDDEKLTYKITGILAFAIAKGLRQAVLKLFQDETFQLKDRFKVVYYALMQLMEAEYPDEIRKMGKELEEPVQEMVNYIKELEGKYKEQSNMISE